MNVIEVTGLRKAYGDQVVLDDVSFSVERGEIFGILGPNGAGKTTMVECVEGLRRPDGGTVSVLGLDPWRDRAELRRRVGVQLQESRLPERMRVAEALDLYASFYPRPEDWRALIGEWGLESARNTAFAKLSGGRRQRLFIALALIGGPELVVLDELTTGLDPQARRDTWALVERIRDRGVTVLLVTHFMEEAERLCDRLAVIDTGRVVALGTPAGIVAKAAPEQVIRFRPSGPPDDARLTALLTALPQVTAVRRTGGRVEVTGRGDLLQAVTALLAREQIIAAELRVDQSGLDEAFVALTGHHPRPAEPAHAKTSKESR